MTDHSSYVQRKHDILTAIIGIYTPNKIIIASDSKETSSKPEEVRGPALKIHQVNSLFFAIAGVSASLETGLNMDNIIHAALNSADGIAEKIANLNGTAIPALQRAMQYSYDKERKYFDEHFKEKVVSEIFICGVSEEQLFVRRLIFGTEVKEDKVEVRQLGDGGIPAVGNPPPKCRIFSNSEELQTKIMAATSEEEAIKTPESVAEKYVAAAINENSDLVGMPIDILEISKTGARWLRRKKECPEIAPFTLKNA